MYKGARRVLLNSGAVALTPLILDTVAGILAAYTPRKVFLSGQPDPIEVRESGGGTTQVIGFSGNDLDQAGLEAFMGAGNAFVTYIDEASGSGNKVSQAVAANQPQIGSSGSMLVTPNGKPRIAADGVNDFLATASALTKPANWTLACVHFISNITVRQRTCGSGNSSGETKFVWAQIGNKLNVGSTNGTSNYMFGDGTNTSSGESNSATYVNGVLQAQLIRYTSGQNFAEIFKDGSVVAMTAIATASTTTAGTAYKFSLHRPGEGDFVYHAGSICETLIFNVALSDGDRTTLKTDQSTYWGTP